ncbi:formate dehydrogenase subunit alpha [Blastopirellula marina]|uniref:nitrate reductase (cytochrome) n=1 Tax=Blastopirellula marina TaxID=124 RepID=A0A2S8FNB2_9BACT|nr:formate dehydrogenase subunit alpha [Blastopirellula marina]PQO33683.1 formate dehydrogenase subunit alpha [Blastopirellula marina]PTL43470.1 formate dehydrogenase subunit alpha [Blastopirellula marina]
MSSFQISINGSLIDCADGERLIDVIQRSAIELSAVCYHPQLGPVQTCDTCAVEVNGELTRACSALTAEGMEVWTNTDRAGKAQREAFDRLLGNHQLYCTVCDNNNGNCTMHNTTKLLQIEQQETPFTPKPYEVDESNPFYRYDPDQCLLCGRCVEACQNVEVNETLSINWEDPNPRVLWDGGAAIGESSCVSCGHCVTVCPCNALMEKSMLGHAGFLTNIPKQTLKGMIDIVKEVEPEIGFGAILKVSEVESEMRQSRIRRTKTVCTYCGVGCSFDIWTKDRHILKVEPEHGAVNGISTCVKGKFGWDFVNSKDRLTKPLLREGNTFREATWEEAFARVAARLAEIRNRDGADAIGLISSSKCSNEESYLMQKLARAVVGTNNIDNCSRYCQAPATMGLFRTVGYGGDSGSVADISQADLVLIVGSNTAESHPVIATRIKSAHKLRGQKLIVSDLREHEMARRADLFIRPRPGTDLIWLSAITRYLIDQGKSAKAFLNQWVNGFDAYYQSLEPFTLEYAEAMTGISIDTLKQLADMIARSQRMVICWAMGVTQHSMGSATSTAISNLLLVTGNYMRPGTGAYPLRGHNNVQGASDLGSMPNMLPGYQHVDDPEVRQRFEEAWGNPLPTTQGLDNHEMIGAILDGQLKAMYLCGEEMSLVDADANLVQQAFSQLEFLVVQDVFFSHTCQFADVVLPASPSLEKEGTFTNTERRIQRFYQVLEPLGDSRPDWQIIQGVANALGANWDYSHPSEIMSEVAGLTPLLAGVSYERLAGYQTQQWPVAADGTGEPLLYTEGFAFPDSKARLYPVEWTEPVDQPNEEFDLHLNNGNLLEHFHEGNLTYRVPGIREKTPEVFVEVSPELARERNLVSGTRVELTSRYGQLQVRVLVTDRVHGKQLYMPMNSTESPVNVLIGSNTDPVTHTPAYKEASVRMRVLRNESSPLPRSNPRFGHPTPQHGVEVERKWKHHPSLYPGPLVQIQTDRKQEH